MFNYIFEARWGCMYDSNGVSKTWLNIFYVRHTIKNNFFTSMCQKIVSKKMPMMRCSISLFSVSKWYLHIVSMFIFFESECQVAVFSHPHANNRELKNWTIFLSVSLWKYFNRQENELSKVIKIVLI